MAKGTVVWTPEEDQQLKKLVSKFGEKKWATIASHFDRKVSKQCRRRWQNVLNANLKQGMGTIVILSILESVEIKSFILVYTLKTFFHFVYCR